MDLFNYILCKVPVCIDGKIVYGRAVDFSALWTTYGIIKLPHWRCASLRGIYIPCIDRLPKFPEKET